MVWSCGPAVMSQATSRQPSRPATPARASSPLESNDPNVLKLHLAKVKGELAAANVTVESRTDQVKRRKLLTRH